MFDVKDSALAGVKLLAPATNFEDFRGSYVELYNKVIFEQAGITEDFIQDDISTSSRHVLRGIHGDGTTWKLISCLHGSFYLVVVNNDPASSEYRKWQGFTLSDRNRLQVLVPPRFGNGHLVLTESAIFHYKQTSVYDRESQFTILWDDPKFAIWWPISDPITSERDQSRR